MRETGQIAEHGRKWKNTLAGVYKVNWDAHGPWAYTRGIENFNRQNLDVGNPQLYLVHCEFKANCSFYVEPRPTAHGSSNFMNE